MYFRRYRAKVLAAHRPICVVYGGALVVIVLELLISGRIFSIVTLHVTAWYVFAMYQFSKRPPPDPAPRKLGWKWMRTTRGGFAFLHLGLCVLMLVAAAVWAYGFRNAPSSVFSMFLSQDVFAYWTIVHITISFVPR